VQPWPKSCPEEGVGTIEFAGLENVVVTYNGDVDCDGCGEMTIDGADAGPFCFEPK
jgi:hypothetical protein